MLLVLCSKKNVYSIFHVYQSLDLIINAGCDILNATCWTFLVLTKELRPTISTIKTESLSVVFWITRSIIIAAKLSKYVTLLNFYSLEILNISSHLRSFRKSGNFGGSFASISLNTNMFFMKIYHNQRL